MRSGGKTQSTIVKVALDQLLCSPSKACFHKAQHGEAYQTLAVLLFFFVSMGLLELQPAQITDRIQRVSDPFAYLEPVLFLMASEGVFS